MAEPRVGVFWLRLYSEVRSPRKKGRMDLMVTGGGSEPSEKGLGYGVRFGSLEMASVGKGSESQVNDQFENPSRKV